MLYLAYGSNLHPARLTQRLPSARPVRTVALDGYRLAFRKRGGDSSAKCDLVRTDDPADRAYGVVYRVDPREKCLLDACEGPGYADSEIEVACTEGPLACFTYLARSEYVDERLRPFRWYRALVLAGARHFGLPDAYVEQIRRIPAGEDPDADRRRVHHRLLSRL